MNNIEILEDYIKLINKGYCEDCNELCNIYGAPAFPSKAISQAIENLIQENEELKEKREEYEKQLDLDYVEENYIPKSKVKEKIEEIKRNDYSSYDTCLCLQELLEEGE
jgi:hypothetical protein